MSALLLSDFVLKPTDTRGDMSDSRRVPGGTVYVHWRHVPSTYSVSLRMWRQPSQRWHDLDPATAQCVLFAIAQGGIPDERQDAA